MSIDSAVLEEKKDEEATGNKKREESGDELERKDQDPPLEIGEHYLVKRGEDSWRKFLLAYKHIKMLHHLRP